MKPFLLVPSFFYFFLFSFLFFLFSFLSSPKEHESVTFLCFSLFFSGEVLLMYHGGLEGGVMKSIPMRLAGITSLKQLLTVFQEKYEVDPDQSRIKVEGRDGTRLRIRDGLEMEDIMSIQPLRIHVYPSDIHMGCFRLPKTRILSISEEEKDFFVTSKPISRTRSVSNIETPAASFLTVEPLAEVASWNQ
jgi:hypothetical protein